MEKRIKIITKAHTEAEPENEQPNDFAKTGISKMSFKIDFNITQKDMEKDLVQKTEGNFIKPDDFDGNKN